MSKCDISKEDLKEDDDDGLGDVEEGIYRPTPEALLWSVLNDWGITNDWNFKIFHGIYEDFMEAMEKSGYVKHVEDE